MADKAQFRFTVDTEGNIGYESVTSDAHEDSPREKQLSLDASAEDRSKLVAWTRGFVKTKLPIANLEEWEEHE